MVGSKSEGTTVVWTELSGVQDQARQGGVACVGSTSSFVGACECAGALGGLRSAGSILLKNSSPEIPGRLGVHGHTRNRHPKVFQGSLQLTHRPLLSLLPASPLCSPFDTHTPQTRIQQVHFFLLIHESQCCAQPTASTLSTKRNLARNSRPP